MGGDIEQFGDYKVIRLLGTGGMGTVYLAEHPLWHRVAVKLLDAGVSRNRQFRRRFEREAELLAMQRHPNVVAVFDRGEHKGQLWMTMEYVEGRDCAKLLKARGPLPLELVTELIAGTASALDYVYSEHQITHRDVKPSNILVDLSAVDAVKAVKLADFGIAKAAGESTAITSTGVTVGTMTYISPEAIEGHILDNRSDLYSLACTAFELLAGSSPYTGTSNAALISAHLNQPPPSITDRNRALPSYLDAVFERALAKDPNARFTKCAEFVSALRAPVAVPGEAFPAYAQTVAARAYAATEPTPVARHMRAPASQHTPTFGTRTQPRLDQRWLLAIGALIAVVVVVVGGLLVFATGDDRTMSTNPAEPAALPPPPAQITLPFIGLNEPVAVAVDTSGNTFVADSQNERVIKLATESSQQQVLPFPGLDGLQAVAVDGSGNVYTLDISPMRDNEARPARVMMLPPNARQPITLPVSVRLPGGLAVDAAGNVYVADSLPGSHVVMLAAGSTTQQELPFTSADGTNGLAVDASGNLYASTLINDRIVMWTASTGQQRVLPFAVSAPRGVAVDSRGAVYATSQRNNLVVQLNPGLETQQVLPYNGLNGPAGVAINRHGNVYVADRVNNRILELPSR